jgi:hypothetical protein
VLRNTVKVTVESGTSARSPLNLRAIRREDFQFAWSAARG